MTSYHLSPNPALLSIRQMQPLPLNQILQRTIADDETVLGLRAKGAAHVVHLILVDAELLRLRHVRVCVCVCVCM